MSIVRQGTLPVGSLDHAITLNVQSSGGSHFETVTDTTPYLHRASPQDVASSMKLKKVVGGTIAWNQMVQNGNFESTSGWTSTRGTQAVSNNELTYTVTQLGGGGLQNRTARSISFPKGHKVFVALEYYATKEFKVIIGLGGATSREFTLSNGVTTSAWNRLSTICQNDVADVTELRIGSPSTSGSMAVGDTYKFRNVILIDITQMFGSTIADYIYSLEQAHAGDGVAWFKALFGEDYYPYNSGELLSVKTSARKTYNADNVEIGSYALDDNLTLRGIPKLDGNNELYYDGDTYASDGTVTRRYGVVDLGSLNWLRDENQRFMSSSVSGIKLPISSNFHDGLVCAKYEANDSPITYRTVDKTIAKYTDGRLYILDSAYSDAQTFKTAMSGVYLVYELATPTTESADAYTQSQRVGATEEFVDGRTVEIPVGNVSEYKRLIQGGTA